MKSRWLWNSHQRHKFFRAAASTDILKFRVLEEVFSSADAMLFSQNTCKTGNSAIKMSRAFLDIARF